MARFRFFLYGKDDPVIEGEGEWSLSLPMGRDGSSGFGATALLKDYFTLCEEFLGRDDFAAIWSVPGMDRSDGPVDFVDICLKKHGEYYHPARVDVWRGERSCSFVLDVGISEAGRALAGREYDILGRLNRDSEKPFLPLVYSSGDVALENGISASMFLGEWFEDFHEFHISASGDSLEGRVVVWDAQQGNYYLTRDQAWEVYSSAAAILTSHYNFDTGEEIFPFRHAAGDFVLRASGGEMEVRLITARNYGILFGGGEEESPFHSLFNFFLNMSMFMRLDRLDGVGEVAWLGDYVLEASVDGFFKGLDIKPEVAGLPDTLGACFRGYLTLFSRDDIFDFCQSLVEAYNPKMPEMAVLREKLPSHADKLSEILSEIGTIG